MSSLVLLALVAMWAAVLVPMWLRRHERSNEVTSAVRFAGAMHLLTRRAAPHHPAARHVMMPRRPAGSQDMLVTAPESRQEREQREVAERRRAEVVRSRAADPRAAADRRIAVRRRIALGLLVGLVLTVVAAVVAGGPFIAVQAFVDVLVVVGLLHLRAEAAADRRRAVRRVARARAEREAARDTTRHEAPERRPVARPTQRPPAVFVELDALPVAVGAERRSIAATPATPAAGTSRPASRLASPRPQRRPVQVPDQTAQPRRVQEPAVATMAPALPRPVAKPSPAAAPGPVAAQHISPFASPLGRVDPETGPLPLGRPLTVPERRPVAPATVKRTAPPARPQARPDVAVVDLTQPGKWSELTAAGQAPEPRRGLDRPAAPVAPTPAEVPAQAGRRLLFDDVKPTEWDTHGSELDVILRRAVNG